MPQTTTDTGLPKSDGIKSRLVRSFNGRLLYSVCLIAVSQINFGFDQGVFTNTQAMSQFQRKFGSYDDDTGTWSIPPYFLSLLNSLTYVGFVFGLLSGSAISKRYGRRICMFTMCIWALIGALIMVTAQHKAQILVGRVVAYIYIGMELAVVPVTQAELVPAQVRGLVIGSYQSGILLGQLLGALVCLGTEHADGDRAWRIPIGLLFIIPVLVAVGIFWVPESPRWLMVRHRDDDARKALHLLRKGKFSDEEIKNELRDLQATIDQTVDKGQFRELFQGTNLKRTLIVVGVNVFLQLTGQNFISVYGTIFLKELKTVNPFGLTAGSTSISICIVLLTQYLTDITGRKPLMVAGAIVQCACLFTMGGLGTVSNPSLGIRQGITAMYVVFGAGFSLGWAPLSHAVAAEIPTTKLRDKTYAFGAVFNIVIQWAVSFSIPYLLYEPYAALGSRVGFIFGSTAFLCIFFTWFCIPECSGKSLEEIDELFLRKTPLKEFRSATVEKPSRELMDLKGGVRVEQVENASA